MEKNTKILIGVGIAVVAFVLYKTRITPTIKTNTPKLCPDGTIEKQVQCGVAPCPTQCMPIKQDPLPPKPLKDLQENNEYSSMPTKGCPDGTKEIEVNCIMAPCAPMCLPINGFFNRANTNV